MLGGGLDGGDGFAVGGELRARAGAVVGVFGLGGLGFELGPFGVALVLGEIGGGELEGVEEESGATEVDVVACDAGDDATDRVLNLGAGVRCGHAEGVAAGTAPARVGDGATILVMVVAILFAVHGG